MTCSKCGNNYVLDSRDDWGAERKLSATTSPSWAELEAKCLASCSYEHFTASDGGPNSYEANGIRYAFAFLARHLPPASVEMRKMLEVCREEFCWLANNKKQLSTEAYAGIVDRIETALKAVEGGER